MSPGGRGKRVSSISTPSGPRSAFTATSPRAPPGRRGPTSCAAATRARRRRALRSTSRLSTRQASRTARYFCDRGLARGRRAVEDLLACLLGLRQLRRDQLLQRVGDDVRVLVVQHEADVAELLVASPMADVVQHQHVGDRQVGAAGRRHAADRPARERVPRDDQAELELRQLDAARRDQVRRRDDAARRRASAPRPCAGQRSRPVVRTSGKPSKR